MYLFSFLELITRCPSSPCQNGGSCEEDEVKRMCTCPDSFDGDFCETGKKDFVMRNSQLFSIHFPTNKSFRAKCLFSLWASLIKKEQALRRKDH